MGRPTKCRETDECACDSCWRDWMRRGTRGLPSPRSWRRYEIPVDPSELDGLIENEEAEDEADEEEVRLRIPAELLDQNAGTFTLEQYRAWDAAQPRPGAVG